MKARFVFYFFSAVVFVSCDKDFGTACPGCTQPGANDPRSSILLNVHVTIPSGLYSAEQATQIVDVADLALQDATTKEVIARKQVAIKGNGDVVDGESVPDNTAFLYSSQVKLDAPWDMYLITFHTQLQSSIATERVIDCTSGSAVISFAY